MGHKKNVGILPITERGGGGCLGLDFQACGGWAETCMALTLLSWPCRGLPEGDSVQQGCEGWDGRRPTRLQL